MSNSTETPFNFWCGKCRNDLVFYPDHQWGLLHHLKGQCKEDNPSFHDDPPEWIKERKS